MNFNHFDKKKSELVYEGRFVSIYHRKFPGGVYEYAVMRDSVKVVAVTRDKKILIIKEKIISMDRPYYSLPGGGVEEGEDLIVAAKRELEEETGYTSDDVGLWFSNNYSQTVISSKHFLIAKDCVKSSDVKLEETESISAEEVSFDEFLDLVTTEEFKHTELKNHFFRMKLDASYRDEFEKMLFGE